MKILIIGGSGNISWHCVEKFAQRGNEVWVLNRRKTVITRRAFINNNIHVVVMDINDKEKVKKNISNMRFDIAIDFLCFSLEDAYRDIELFEGRVKQFIYISSTANYNRVGITYPIKEQSNIFNDNWQYAKNKIDCEKLFLKKYCQNNFPVTIIRPGHTYDTILPEAVGYGDWTNALRIMKGEPIIVHGDGNNLWTATHSSDFAEALVELVNNKSTIGKCYHITSNEILTWNEITYMLMEKLGNSNSRIIYIPSTIINKEDASLGAGLIGHKMWCDFYDNSKVKLATNGWEAEIRFEKGVSSTIEWLKEDIGRQRVNKDLDDLISKLCDSYS